MKFVVLIICLFGFQNVLLSQKIVVPNKKWEGAYFGNPSNTFQSKFRSSKKTIEGIDYNELMYKVNGGWFEGVKQYYREDGDKVYRLYQGEEKLLFDFGLAVGDTIEISDDYGGVFEFFPVRIVDTLIFDNLLKKLELRVKPEGQSVSNVPHVWIEGVGDVGFFFGNGYVFGNQNASPLFCVREFEKFFEAGMECPGLFLTASKEESENLHFKYDAYAKKIYVNNENVDRLDLYSITGERINSIQIDSNTNEIDVSDVLHSICVIMISSGNSYTSKILKMY